MKDFPANHVWWPWRVEGSVKARDGHPSKLHCTPRKVSIHVCLSHTHTYARLYINYICLWYVYVRCIYIYVSIFVCMYLCICIYIYIYTHTPTEAWWCDGSGVPHLWDLTTLLPSRNLRRPRKRLKSSSEWIKLTSRIKGAAILAVFFVCLKVVLGFSNCGHVHNWMVSDDLIFFLHCVVFYSTYSSVC